jgi:serine/alanine adding enzyme
VGEWLDAAGHAAAWADRGDDDPYLRPEYLAAAAIIGAGEVAAWRDGGVLYPFLVRFLPGGRCDLTSAYGYGGPMGAEPGWRARFRAACAERGVVSEFVRFHPLRQNDAGLDDVEVHELQEIVTLAPGAGEADVVAGLRSQGRRNLSRARREGVEVRESHDMDGFHAFYVEAMRALDADPFYLFGADYFAGLARLGDALLLLDAGGAQALYLAGGGALHYHLGGVEAEGRRTGAATLMHVHAAGIARERGLGLLSLGGGLSGGDPLWRFKATIGPGRAPFRIGKAVHDHAAYAELCAAAGVEATTAGRFPAYR